MKGNGLSTVDGSPALEQFLLLGHHLSSLLCNVHREAVGFTVWVLMKACEKRTALHVLAGD